MALGDYFLAPLGLAALASLGVLVALYLISQQPRLVQLPTIQFLERDPQRAGARPRLNQFRRALLFLLQALVLVGCALALASPYLALPAAGQDHAVLVVDTSASMRTTTDGGNRFDGAVSAASGDLAGETSVVTSGSTPAVAAERVPQGRARAALGALSATDAPGDLAGAISLATSTARAGGTIHVYSDFADATDWRGAIERARARGYRIVLHRTGGGGRDNVGIVDLSLGRTSVTATIRNTGTAAAQRSVSLGDQRETVSLQPGDVETVNFEVPAGGGRLELSPGDSFGVDDVVPVGAPTKRSISVLVLTNDEDQFLTTALGLVDEFDVRVERLPASVSGEYDVVVFSNVEPDRVLAGNLALARATLESGGGVIVMGQRGLGQVGYGQLLLVQPSQVATSTGPTTVVEDALTEGLSFPPPDEHVVSTLRRGQALVRTSEGTPLVARDSYGGGQLLYYGYLDESGFPFDSSYPVFWKRAIYAAAGRPSLASLNRRTGDRLTFETATTVATPTGRLTGTVVPLQRVGFYEYGDRRVGVGLLNGLESNLTSGTLPGGGDGDGGSVVVGDNASGPARQQSLVPLVVGLAFIGLAGELALLRYRGDL